MIRLIFINILSSSLFCQILPTVPKNIFRVSFSNNISDKKLTLSNQRIDMRGISRMYLNNGLRSGINNPHAAYDLYHMADISISDSSTVGSYLKSINTKYDIMLPTFRPEGIDTTKSLIFDGTFTEKIKGEEISNIIKVDYGFSDEITLFINIPLIKSSSEDYSISLKMNDIKGIDDIVDYHNSTKASFDLFFESPKYLNLGRLERDTLKLIYDDIYSASGNYSVLWAQYAENDLWGKGFINKRFIPSTFAPSDTVTLNELINYYLPKKRESSGINDITIGTIILLKGTPAWENNSSSVFYGQLKLTIPFGSTTMSYEKVGEKQFSQKTVGLGVSNWGLSLYGGQKISKIKNVRLYGNLNFNASPSEIVNTPINILSGVHTNPDSILSRVGATHRFKRGNAISYLFGYDNEISTDRILIKFEYKNFKKKIDKFVSLDNEWDSWMGKHIGYSSAYQYSNIRSEIWILNSGSNNKLGPTPFDIVLGCKFTTSSKYSAKTNEIYLGIVTYLQGW